MAPKPKSKEVKSYNPGRPVRNMRDMLDIDTSKVSRDMKGDANVPKGMTTADSIAVQRMLKTLRTQEKIGAITSKVGETLNNATPYVSNIAQAFRKAPMPHRGRSISATPLTQVSLEAERNAINQATRNTDLIGDMNLDANTAASVRGSNLATRLKALGDSYSREAQMNVAQNARQAQMNLQVDSYNAAKSDEYGDALVERQIAQQRQAGQNLANFADKRVASMNEKATRDLDLQKFKVLSRMYKDSGVMDRFIKEMGGSEKALGIEKKALGGPIGDPIIPKPGNARPQPLKYQANKELGFYHDAITSALVDPDKGYKKLMGEAALNPEMRDVATAMKLFYGRDDFKGMNTMQRINNFFTMNQSVPMVAKLKPIAGDPMSAYNSSPTIRRWGGLKGKIKKTY